MQRNRVELKLNTRRFIRESGGKVFLASTVLVVLAFVISLLIARLSGTAQFLQNASRVYAESYTEMTEVVEELGTTDVAAEKVYEIMDDAVRRAYVWPENDAVSYILSAALAALLALLNVGFVSYCMLVSRGEEAGIRDIFNSFSCTGKMLAILVLRAVIVAAGFALFIIPGVVLLYCYRLSPYIAYDNPDLGPIACMKRSRRLMKGKKAELFTLDISFAGWWFLSQLCASFTLPIVDIWIEPYIGITVAQWYNNTSGYTPQEKGIEYDNG